MWSSPDRSPVSWGSERVRQELQTVGESCCPLVATAHKAPKLSRPLGWAHTPESLTLRMGAGPGRRTHTRMWTVGVSRLGGALRVAPYSPWIHAGFVLCVEGFRTLTLIRFAWLGPAVSREVSLLGTL